MYVCIVSTDTYHRDGFICARMYVCVYVCMYVCMYGHVCTYVCMYVRMYVRVYVCLPLNLGARCAQWGCAEQCQVLSEG